MPYVFNIFTGQFDAVGGTPTIGTFNSTSTANGLDIAGTILSLHAADTTNPGAVTTTTQSFAGNKTFTGTITASNLSGTNTGDVTIGTANGISLAGQVLSLALATSSLPGAVLNIGSAN